MVDETIALFHWLAWVAEQLYGEEGRGAARRWVLRRLERDGPQTVPALARAKASRRQSVQPVVDVLVEQGLVVRVANPRHAKSPQVRVTPAGARLVAHMDDIDARVLRAVSKGISTPDLTRTASTLRALRESFEVESRWRRVLGD